MLLRLAMAAALVSSQIIAQNTPQNTAQNQARQQFLNLCSLCHGSDGTGTDRGPSLGGNRRQRLRSSAEVHDLIKNGTPAGMPAFDLPEVQLQALVDFVRSLNSTAFELKPEGDVADGESIFFGSGGCASCHMVNGRGSAQGPDLSSIARQMSLGELEESLTNPSARIAQGYGVVELRLKNGRTVRGFARNQGKHDIQIQTVDGRLQSLLDTEYESVARSKDSAMPPFHGSVAQHRDLLAYLSRLGGPVEGPMKDVTEIVSPESIQQILQPEPADWPTYHGRMSGNRHSTLDQINVRNVSGLRLEWSYSIPYFGLETTPLVIDGQMFVTGPNQVFALDARTGREIWRYARARTSGGIAGDAAKGANRGVAVLGDRVFFATDNAHLICLNRLTGALMWDVYMPEKPEHYGATSAPLVANDLVISGVAGGDEGIRGFIAAYKATSGELAWRFWTVPKPGEPGSETWGDQSSLELGGGSTWLTGTYDPESGLLYWPTGNPFPDTDGEVRKGDNLYTDCILALDLKTGKLKWHFQFTPHDLHDWDAVQPPVLVDTVYKGRARKLLLQANRSGFFYVLDRTTGELLLAKPFVKKLTWASGIGADGRPQLLPNNETTPTRTKTCPAVRGATNWYSTAYNPTTRLYYLMTVEDCGTYWRASQGGFGFNNSLTDPGHKYLRALNIETGEIVWEVPQIGPVESNYSGVLSTAGGLVFYGETGGGFAAVDAATGGFLWHFEAHQPWKASPMTYMVKGRQYVAIASGANILVFSLTGTQ